MKMILAGYIEMIDATPDFAARWNDGDLSVEESHAARCAVPLWSGAWRGTIGDALDEGRITQSDTETKIIDDDAAKGTR